MGISLWADFEASVPENFSEKLVQLAVLRGRSGGARLVLQSARRLEQPPAWALAWCTGTKRACTPTRKRAVSSPARMLTPASGNRGALKRLVVRKLRENSEEHNEALMTRLGLNGCSTGQDGI